MRNKLKVGNERWRTYILDSFFYNLELYYGTEDPLNQLIVNKHRAKIEWTSSIKRHLERSRECQLNRSFTVYGFPGFSPELRLSEHAHASCRLFSPAWVTNSLLKAHAPRFVRVYLMSSVIYLTIRLWARDFFDSWWGRRPNQLSPHRNRERIILLF